VRNEKPRCFSKCKIKISYIANKNRKEVKKKRSLSLGGEASKEAKKNSREIE